MSHFKNGIIGAIIFTIISTIILVSTRYIPLDHIKTETKSNMSSATKIDNSILSTPIDTSEQKPTIQKKKPGNNRYPKNISKMNYVHVKNSIDSKKPVNASNTRQVQVTNSISFSSIRFIAHRGGNFAPENTLPNYASAAKKGFWGGETDIRLTSDNIWVVMHDATVNRTTNGKGAVRSFTLSGIKALKIHAGNNIAKYPGLKVPTFEEYLLTCKKAGLVPITEIKPASGYQYTAQNYSSLADIIRKYNMENNMVLISFDSGCLIAIRKLLPNVTVAPILPITQANLNLCKKLGKAMIDAGNPVTPSQIQLAHKNGIKVMVWTIDNINSVKTYIAEGVDYITSDCISKEVMTMHYQKGL